MSQDMDQVQTDLETDSADASADASQAVTPSDDELTSLLDREGEAAADYLEELLDIADLDGDIDIEVKAGRVYISVATEPGEESTLDSLVGADGETLDALQDLTRLAVLASTGERSRVILDIAGHRSRRGERLAQQVTAAIDTVKETGEAQALTPMTPYERKQAHDLVAEAGLVSDSEGEGNKRHVVVHPSES